MLNNKKGTYMSNNDGWVEIGGGEATDMWNREGTITGKVKSRKSGVGPNNSMVYQIETDKGEIGVWGSTVLDTKFEQIKDGDNVRIEYLGKAKSQRGGEYHDYKVSVKPADDKPVSDEPVSDEVKQVQDTLGGEVL